MLESLRLRAEPGRPHNGVRIRRKNQGRASPADERLNPAKTHLPFDFAYDGGGIGKGGRGTLGHGLAGKKVSHEAAIREHRRPSFLADESL